MDTAVLSSDLPGDTLFASAPVLLLAFLARALMMSLHLVGGTLVPYDNQEKSHVGERMIMASSLIANGDLRFWCMPQHCHRGRVLPRAASMALLLGKPTAVEYELMVKWNVGVAMSELACKVYFDKLEMESVGDVLGL